MRKIDGGALYEKLSESDVANKLILNMVKEAPEIEENVLYLDSENGMRYTVEVISVNDFREPSMKYAIDLVDCNGVRYSDCYGDYYFVGQDFIDKCYK